MTRSGLESWDSGEDFPASSQFALAMPTQGLLLSWLPTLPVNLPGVGSADLPKLSHLGSVSLLALSKSGADDGSAACPLQECKGCLRCTSCIWALEGGSLSASLPTTSRPLNLLTPTPKLSPGRPAPAPVPTTGSWELELGVTLSRGLE